MLHTLETKQCLPISLNEAWNFLSSPQNLAVITPPHMGFHILSGFTPGDAMYQGMIIEYTVKPIAFIPIHWVTEITHVKHMEYFIDEQRFGPYSFWHHTHMLKEIPGGIEMHDIVRYKLPLGFIGKWIHRLFVRKQLQQIFTFRENKLKELFGEFIGNGTP